MERQLVVNRTKCLLCGDMIVSKHRHDYVSCSCSNLTLDGGVSCPRGIFKEREFCINYSLYTDDNFEDIRQHVYRGSYGADGKQPLEWVRLCDMSDEHLKNLIKYKTDNNETKDVHFWAYCREMEYRGQTTSN